MGKGNRDGKKRKKTGIRILIVLLLMIVIAAAGGIYYLNSMNEPFSPGSEDLVMVEIPSGSSTTAIADQLEEQGIIADAQQFRIKSRLTGNDGRYKAGTYEVSPGMTMEEIMDVLIAGIQKQTAVTVLEGYTLEQTAEAMEKAGICTKDEFLQETQYGEFDYPFMEYVGTGEKRLEGFLYPETYYAAAGMSAHDAVDMMLAQFNRVFTQEYYDRAAEIGMTPRDIVIIASMIQRETLALEEGAKVASVIYNRLEDGMRLQIDATVQYALGEQKDRLLYSDLEVDSPYNTYKVDGLPAGPICQPHQQAIEAALWPEDTDYMFYVLRPDGSGLHNFAATDTEFAKYRQEYLNSL